MVRVLKYKLYGNCLAVNASQMLYITWIIFKGKELLTRITKIKVILYYEKNKNVTKYPKYVPFIY